MPLFFISFAFTIVVQRCDRSAARHDECQQAPHSCTTATAASALWVNYWQGLTGDRVCYRPYQEAAADFPEIPPEAFPHAVQLIEPDGQVYSGAAATYRVLRHAPGRAAWWWLYTHLPGFSLASEWAYAFFARRRGLLDRVSKLLWGPALEPERYELVSWVFLHARRNLCRRVRVARGSYRAVASP